MSGRFPALLLCIACASQRSAERDEADRLSSNERSMPSAGGEDSSSGSAGEAARQADPPPARSAAAPRKTSMSSGSVEEMMKQAELSAQRLNEAKARADADCGKLQNRAVPWAEEALMGQLFSIPTAKSLYLDTDEKNPLALPRTDKNVLVEYVQRVGMHVASASSRPGIPWTFGVVDSAEARAWSQLGGYVFITTGRLAQLKDEAQLAAVLALEISRVAAKDPVNAYAKARFSSCNVAVMGYYLVEAGGAEVPGGNEFIRSAKFGKTMLKFASVDAKGLFDDPQTDGEFIMWFLNRQLDVQNMIGVPPELELAADRSAAELLAASGYDSTALLRVNRSVDNLHAPGRREALEKLLNEGSFGTHGGGKSPPFPKELKWPKE